MIKAFQRTNLDEKYEYDPSTSFLKSNPSSSELEQVSQVQSLDHSSLSLPAFTDFSFLCSPVEDFGELKVRISEAVDFCNSCFRLVRIL